MLPLSVRRVVSSSAPSSPALSSFASAAFPRTAAAAYTISSLSTRHQRRCSSSKPSSPADGPKDIPAGQSVPASSTQSAKSTGEKRGRKAKEPQAAAHKLPSVPSTQHLPLDTLALSSFFSQHRPISITHSLPKAISEDAFAAIFSARSRAQKNSDVINTLSRTVNQLDGPMASMTLQEGEQQEDNMHRIELKHPDGSESSIYVQLSAMSGQFLPFQPPPLPSAETEEAAAAGAADTGAEQDVEQQQQQQQDEEPHRRVYKAVLTIEEQVDADGQIKITAHSPQIIEESAVPRSFLERMAVRHLKYEEAQRQREKLLAISVKRIRKLKMKKKKYKKLMKRTRNLRRRQDRT